MTTIQPVPTLVLPAPFPTTADRVAGVYNAKAKAWADGESDMAANQHALAQVTHNNATVALEQAGAAETARQQAVDQTTAIKDAAVSETSAIRDAAIDARDAAAVSKTLAQAAANYKGQWSTLSGALNTPASVWHNGAYWGLLSNLANVATAQPGVSSAWAAVGTQVYRLGYDSRASLRTLGYPGLEWAIVDGLGLFAFAQGSTEPDDDESCFATAGGRWLLMCPAWDAIDAWMQPVQQSVDDRLDAQQAVRATVASPISSVASGAKASFTVGLPGASMGRSASVSPPADLAAALSAYARVTGADLVTVYINNPSAASASVSTDGWQVTVV